MLICSPAVMSNVDRHNKYPPTLVADIQRGLQSMESAAKIIRRAYTDIDPDNNVSLHGTWHKRGFTSNYGIGMCIGAGTS